MAEVGPDTTEFEAESDPSKGGTLSADAKGKDLSDLLALEPNVAAKLLMQKWREQDRLMQTRMNEWKVNRLRRMGITGVTVVKERDQKAVQVWVPPGPQIPSLNKADRLCRRVAATLFSDPAVPEALPAGDEDADREAADMSGRVLIDMGSESKLDDHGQNRRCFDLGSTYGSGFRHYFVDPTGNGSRPMQVTCNAGVQTVQEATTDPGPEPWVTKYVLKDGTLADENGPEVRTQWLPRVRDELLTGKHCRFVPATAVDVWAAEGMMIGSIRTLGELKRIYPDIAKLSPDDLKKLTDGKPKTWRDLLPTSVAHAPDKFRSGDTDATDDTLVFYVTLYIKQSRRATNGVFFVAGGSGVHLASGEWKSRDNREKMVPVSQFKQYEEEDQGYGRGLMSLLGEGNEIRSAQIGYFLEHLDRFANRKTWLPKGSGVDAKELQGMTGWAVDVRGGPGGFPVVEDVPDFPRAGEKMLEFTTTEMDDESSLQQTGQGLESGSVKSGIHAHRIIEQALVGLSDLRENAIRATTRGWRIELQLIRDSYTATQMLGWSGDDGQHRLKEWSASDLGSTSDVQLSRGSFTSMTASAKAATVQAMVEMGAIDANEVRRMLHGGVGAVVGLEDNPHLLRVRRQISQWNDGPPEEAEQQMRQAQIQLQQAQQVDPEAAAMMQEQVLAQLAQTVFDPRPVDNDMAVAGIRAEELGRALASTIVNKWPPWWQQILGQAYEQARLAAGIFTLEEQMQQQQQDADADAAAAEQERAAAQDVQVQDQEARALEQEQQSAEAQLERRARMQEAQLKAESAERVAAARQPVVRA